MFQVAYYIVLFPGVFLSVSVLAINLLGDGLRDALDPRLARRMWSAGMATIDEQRIVAAAVSPGRPLLEVDELKTWFFTRDGIVRAVDGVSFHVAPSETLAIVGESGCGKSVTALSVLRLIPSPPGRIVSGSIRFAGRDLLAAQRGRDASECAATTSR